MVALVLTGLTMRVAVTSVGAVLTELQRGLHASSAMVGIITTLPVIVFAVIGFVGPRLAHRIGEHSVVVTSLLAATVGLAARAFASAFWLFATLSVFALAGGAITNVLMPTLVNDTSPTASAPSPRSTRPPWRSARPRRLDSRSRSRKQPETAGCSESALGRR